MPTWQTVSRGSRRRSASCCSAGWARRAFLDSMPWRGRFVAAVLHTSMELPVNPRRRSCPPVHGSKSARSGSITRPRQSAWLWLKTTRPDGWLRRRWSRAGPPRPMPLRVCSLPTIIAGRRSCWVVTVLRFRGSTRSRSLSMSQSMQSMFPRPTLLLNVSRRHAGKRCPAGPGRRMCNYTKMP